MDIINGHELSFWQTRASKRGFKRETKLREKCPRCGELYAHNTMRVHEAACNGMPRTKTGKRQRGVGIAPDPECTASDSRQVDEAMAASRGVSVEAIRQMVAMKRYPA